MSTTRDAVLNANDRPLVPIIVPDWNVTVWVNKIGLDEHEAIQANFLDGMLLSLKDADGALLFTADDLPALKKKSLSAINFLAGEYAKVNGFDQKAVERAKGN
jgi:hypothetical protein